MFSFSEVTLLNVILSFLLPSCEVTASDELEGLRGREVRMARQGRRAWVWLSSWRARLLTRL